MKIIDQFTFFYFYIFINEIINITKLNTVCFNLFSSLTVKSVKKKLNIKELSIDVNI